MFILVKGKIKRPIKRVSDKDLMLYRLSGEAGLVIKCQDKVFLAKLPRKHDLTAQAFGVSLCESCDCVCQHCPFSSALTLPILLHIGFNFSDAVKRYGRPERYAFINFAVEIFDKKTSECIVLECANYRKRNPEDYEEQYFAETIWAQKNSQQSFLKIVGGLFSFY